MNNLFKAFFAASVVIGSFTIAKPADAFSFGFSYSFESGDLLSGSLEGEILEDNNTVFVTSVSSVLFNNAPTGSSEFVDSFTNLFGSGHTAQVSLDGSIMDFVSCTASQCFGLFDGEGSFDLASYISPPTGNFLLEQYKSANWTLLPITDPTCIPTPAAILPVFAAMFAAARKKKYDISVENS